MLTANGITLSTDEWARRLRIAPYAITHAIAEGLSMQAIADLYTTEALPSMQGMAERPQTPPNRPDSHAGPLLQTPGGSFTFKTLCVQCADQAKNFYDLAHSAHKEQQRLEEVARERAWHDTMFDFVDMDAHASSQAHVAASIVTPAENNPD